jgi:hypothetical protein
MSSYPIGDPAELKDGESAVIGISTKKRAFKDFKNNILNSYRSLTYSFTLAALDVDAINNHSYEASPLKNIILKSGGKGESTLTPVGNVATPVASELSLAKNVDTTNFDRNDFRSRKIAQDTVRKKWDANKIIEGFNKFSAGRFDMFIDNVEIDGLMNFNNVSGTTLGTNIQFTVTEPHSISGFIEALQAASLAAGYLNYVNAVFLLKIDFWGYPDNVDVVNSKPELINDAGRYFPFIFTEVGVEISQEGAKYNCKGTFYGDRSLGKSNEIKQNISMSGKKVKDILENLFKNINDQIVDNDKQSKTDNFHDEYEIKFPQTTPSGKFDFNKVNKIGF